MEKSTEIDCHPVAAVNTPDKHDNQDEEWNTPTDNKLGTPEVDEAAYQRDEVTLPAIERRQLPGTRNRERGMQKTELSQV